MPFAPSIFSAFCRPDGSICVYPIGYFVVFLIECKSFHAPITFIHSTIVLATSQHRPCPQRTPEGRRFHFLSSGMGPWLTAIHTPAGRVLLPEGLSHGLKQSTGLCLPSLRSGRPFESLPACSSKSTKKDTLMGIPLFSNGYY